MTMMITTVTSLQQVLVDLEAVVTGVRNNDVAVVGDRKTLGTIERVSRCVDKRQE